MRRAGPILILIIGLAALVLDFWPGLKLPSLGGSSATDRVVETKLGLDLEGGVRVEYQALPVKGIAPDSDAMNTIKDIIERRVNSIGVSEPEVVTQGSDRVVVELPGVSDEAAIQQLVGQTGLLEFIPLPPAKYGTASTTTTGGPNGIVENEPLPNDPSLVPLFGGSAVTSAVAGTDQNGLPVVDFELSGDAASKFGTYTTNNVGNFFAIVLDNTVISAPSINSAIPNGHGEITVGSGSGAQAEVNNLVTVLKYGSLPFPIQFVQGTTISATLGSAFLAQSLLGGGIGIGLVFLFMLLYYRLPGLLADGALIYYSLVVYALFRLIPVTLTLAGIAGFVLSIGMAVDANILIFERTKEELRSGKSLPSSIEAGFNRAWNSILDSNVSSLITATILYSLGSSVIRGFALVLILGVLVSMFSAIVVTRTVLRWIVRQ
ncbi:MAG: protein translocase subunit SecD, partial [Candidatus Limnocylindrales bacterium]